MAYKPLKTSIMDLASKNGFCTIPGVEALVMQGIEQFKIWTVFTLPYNIAKSAVMSFYK